MTSPPRVLVVEDSEEERRSVVQLLRAEGFDAIGVENADKAVGYIDERIDAVLSDLSMGSVSGVDLLLLWKKRQPQTPFVLFTAHSSVNTAVQAMKAGAYDYLTKPVNPEELVLVLRRAVDSTRKDREIEDLRRRLDQKFGLEHIIGQSQPMKAVFARIQRAAVVDSTVLILGESGTGKELVAQALHHNSRRRAGPFVAVNCAAVPSTLVESELFGHVRGAFTGATDRRIGRFEQADGGTLFIDEIGDFELSLQAKLLRVLETLTVTPVGGHEDRKVDVRVIAATSRNLVKMVRDGTFRQDLFYRLNVVTIELPPLRDRRDDIPLLVDHFIEEISLTKQTPPRRVDPALMQRLMTYDWPGNVRELRNVLESMMVLAEGEILTERDLPPALFQERSTPVPAGDALAGLTLKELERQAIICAMRESGGRRTLASRKLGISVRTLQRKLREYNMAGDNGDLRDNLTRHDNM